MKWHIDWRKWEILDFFVIVLEVEDIDYSDELNVLDYMPLYGNKTPSEYVCIHLNIADNYCLTALHLSVEK